MNDGFTIAAASNSNQRLGINHSVWSDAEQFAFQNSSDDEAEELNPIQRMRNQEMLNFI